MTARCAAPTTSAARSRRRGLSIGVVGVPKTIDNDIPHIGQSFGFSTAFAKAAESIKAARVEVEAAVGGVGIVKVMGRHAGFIACYAALANHDADFVLIPEVQFRLDGENGLLPLLARRVAERGSAVIVLAEGAGQELIPADDRTDASGNAVLGDIAGFLRDQIGKDFANRVAAADDALLRPRLRDPVGARPTRPTRSTARAWRRSPCTPRWPDAPTWSSDDVATASSTSRSRSSSGLAQRLPRRRPVALGARVDRPAASSMR